MSFVFNICKYEDEYTRIFFLFFFTQFEQLEKIFSNKKEKRTFHTTVRNIIQNYRVHIRVN